LTADESLKLDRQLQLEILNYSIKDRAFWLAMLNSMELYYFDDKNIRIIFQLFQHHFEKYNDLPSRLILIDKLKRGGAESNLYTTIIDQIYDDTFGAKDKDPLLDTVKDFAKRARTTNALWKSVELLPDNKFDEISELMKEALLFNIDVDLGIDLWDIDSSYAQIKDTKQVSSGWRFLDNIIDGGFEEKCLYCFGAPPGVGKSIFLQNIGVNALLRNYNVAVYTLEISALQLRKRYDACLTGIPALNLKYELENLKKKMNEVRARTEGRLNIKEFPTYNATVNTLRAHLETLKVYKGFIPDLIIVDYADIMKPLRSYTSKYEELGDIYGTLRGLAVEMGVPIITASQTNRESMDKESGGTKEVISGALIADSIIKLQILDFFATISQTQQQFDQNKYTLFIAKNRNGEAYRGAEFAINYGIFKLKELMSS